MDILFTVEYVLQYYLDVGKGRTQRREGRPAVLHQALQIRGPMSRGVRVHLWSLAAKDHLLHVLATAEAEERFVTGDELVQEYSKRVNVD